MTEDLYTKAMDGIREKVALQEIRKLLRSKDKECVKLEKVIAIVHSYEEDAERAELEAERRAIEADEAQMRREKIDEMFEGMKPDFDKLTIRKGEKHDP